MCASHFSRVWLFVTLWTVFCQALLSMGFFRQEYRSGLPCPPPGDLPAPGTKPASLMSPACWQWILYHHHHLGGPKDSYASSVLRYYFVSLHWKFLPSVLILIFLVLYSTLQLGQFIFTKSFLSCIFHFLIFLNFMFHYLN